MRGTSDPQPLMCDPSNLEPCVTADHPMRKSRPWIDTARIRQLCAPLETESGRPSISPAQRVLALLGGSLLGVTSDRALVCELTGNRVLRWLVGLAWDQRPGDHATASQNRTRRVTERGLLDRVFDEPVGLALTQRRGSPPYDPRWAPGAGEGLAPERRAHGSLREAGGVHAPDSVAGCRAGAAPSPGPGQSPGHVSRGAALQAPHGSTTAPDAKWAHKGTGTAALVGSTVHELMANRPRLLLGLNVEAFRGPAAEPDGGRALIDPFHRNQRPRSQTVGADNGELAQPFLTALIRRRLRPPIAAKPTGREAVHQQVRRRRRTGGPPLAASPEDDRRTVGRGEMLARVPAVSAPGPATGPRGGLADGLAAESEAAGAPAPGSSLVGCPTATGRAGSGSSKEGDA
jgi:hypothetical protein